MRRLTVFNSVSLDGYFTGANDDLSWAHKMDPEWNEFVASNTRGESVLVFGRKTYDMMAAAWPRPEMAKSFPDVAKKMNSAAKVVFSRTLDKATWNNTKLVKADLVAAMRKMKEEAGPDMTILGSGTIVAQLTDARLIDEYQFAVNNVVLGSGRTMFEGVKKKIELRLKSSRAFKNGNLLTVYEL